MDLESQKTTKPATRQLNGNQDIVSAAMEELLWKKAVIYLHSMDLVTAHATKHVPTKEP